MDKAFTVSEKTLKETNGCKGSYDCLKNPKETTCKVLSAIKNELIFVDGKGLPCNYFFNFGNGGYCKCPVRQELYNRYHI